MESLVNVESAIVEFQLVEDLLELKAKNPDVSFCTQELETKVKALEESTLVKVEKSIGEKRVGQSSSPKVFGDSITLLKYFL